jgi:DNA-binding NarL/FixJ family response regulator
MTVDVAGSDLVGALARVVIVDDAPSFRSAARALLERRGCVVVGEADCAMSAIASVERLAPDAVLLDVRLGDDDGFDVARTLTGSRPELAVLLVSDDDYRSCDALIKDCGARGFALKSELAKVAFAELWPPVTRAARVRVPTTAR